VGRAPVITTSPAIVVVVFTGAKITGTVVGIVGRVVGLVVGTVAGTVVEGPSALFLSAGLLDVLFVGLFFGLPITLFAISTKMFGNSIVLGFSPGRSGNLYGSWAKDSRGTFSPFAFVTYRLSNPGTNVMRECG
jgi:hypothetical protein